MRTCVPSAVMPRFKRGRMRCLKIESERCNRIASRDYDGAIQTASVETSWIASLELRGDRSFGCCRGRPLFRQQFAGAAHFGGEVLHLGKPVLDAQNRLAVIHVNRGLEV